MKRIFVLAHYDNDHEEMLGPYSSMYEAVDQPCHADVLLELANADRLALENPTHD